MCYICIGPFYVLSYVLVKAGTLFMRDATS